MPYFDLADEVEALDVFIGGGLCWFFAFVGLPGYVVDEAAAPVFVDVAGVWCVFLDFYP